MNTNNAFKSLILIPLIASLIFATSCSTDSSNDINALQEQISTLKGELSATEIRINLLYETTKKISDLEMSVSDLEMSVSDLEMSVSDLESENQALKSTSTITNTVLQACISSLIEQIELEINDASFLPDIAPSTQLVGRPQFSSRATNSSTSERTGFSTTDHYHLIQNTDSHTHDYEYLRYTPLTGANFYLPNDCQN